jgi:serine/threonine protein kinase
MKNSGIPLYISPEEVKNEKGYLMSTDVFALGVIFYLLLELKHPFRTENKNDFYEDVVNAKMKPLTSERSSSIVQLLNLMLSKVD